MTSPVVAEVRTPATAREARADRFLARVGALTPAQWGTLDALGHEFESADPVGWWRSARRVSGLASAVPALDDVASLFGFVAIGASSVVDLVRGRRPGPRYTLRPLPPSAGTEARQLHDRFRTLWDLASSQPGGPGAAVHALSLALVAVWLRDHLSPDGFARAYAAVEPVIPFDGVN